MNERFLCNHEMKGNLTKLKTRAKIAEQNVKDLNAWLGELSGNQGENVYSSLHGDLLGIISSVNEDIQLSFPDDHFS